MRTARGRARASAPRAQNTVTHRSSGGARLERRGHLRLLLEMRYVTPLTVSWRDGWLVWWSTVEQPKEETVGTGKAVYIGATLASILVSISFYRSGRQNLAIFVGLWAPTILNLGQTLVDNKDY